MKLKDLPVPPPPPKIVSTTSPEQREISQTKIHCLELSISKADEDQEAGRGRSSQPLGPIGGAEGRVARGPDRGPLGDNFSGLTA